MGGDEEFYSIILEQRGYPAWRWDYDMAIDHALDLARGGKLLDIGAGKGAFLRRLDDKWESYAVEGSELTRCELEDLGIKVFRDLSAAVEAHAATFQAVTLFQVLEHISDFRLLLKQCRELLAIGGRLVVTVPDGDAMIRQERLTGCPDMPPNHISKWTPASLSRAFSDAGFEPQQPIFEPNSWQNVRGALYLRVLADAAHPGSLTSQVYRINNKTIRSFVLAGFGLPALIRMLPHVNQLKRPGAFGMIGIAR